LISAVMISEEAADVIKNHLEKNENIIIEYTVRRPNKLENLEMEYWMEPFNRNSYEFLESLETIWNELDKEKFKLIPRYKMWYCYACKHSHYDGTFKDHR